METYTITASVSTNAVSSTVVISIQANSFNDAFIIGASKFYAMYAGTNTHVVALGVTQPVTP